MILGESVPLLEGPSAEGGKGIKIGVLQRYLGLIFGANSESLRYENTMRIRHPSLHVRPLLGLQRKLDNTPSLRNKLEPSGRTRPFNKKTYASPQNIVS